ncbi:MAG: VOC family protein, partial [Bdellovibrionota bacterium]
MSPANPLGLDGFEFIEFASPDAKILETLMQRLGMKEVARHKTKAMRLFRQADINFVITSEPGSFAMGFAEAHGPCACATGFRVEDANEAFEVAVQRGGKPFTDENGKAGWKGLPAIYGIGDSVVYFVDKYGSRGEINHEGDRPTIYDEKNWQWLTDDRAPYGKGMKVIDHLTNNVPRGEMQKWCDFYTNVFGFQEKRYFDIKGKTTGLFSKVMKSPCGKFSIPINEPQDDKSQIQEYLDEYKGSGIQH